MHEPRCRLGGLILLLLFFPARSPAPELTVHTTYSAFLEDRERILSLRNIQLSQGPNPPRSVREFPVLYSLSTRVAGAAPERIANLDWLNDLKEWRFADSAALAATPDHLYVAGGGSSRTRPRSELFVARLGRDGARDRSYGEIPGLALGGELGNWLSSRVHRLVVDPTGRAIVAAEQFERLGDRPDLSTLLLVRFTKGGRRDPRFGIRGRLEIPCERLVGQHCFNETTDIRVETDGSLLLAVNVTTTEGASSTVILAVARDGAKFEVRERFAHPDSSEEADPAAFLSRNGREVFLFKHDPDPEPEGVGNGALRQLHFPAGARRSRLVTRIRPLRLPWHAPTALARRPGSELLVLFSTDALGTDLLMTPVDPAVGALDTYLFPGALVPETWDCKAFVEE